MKAESAVPNSRKRFRSCIAAIFVSLALADCASVPPEAIRRIEVASTRANHEELAAYYEQEAKAAQAKVEQHLAQAESYKKAVFLYPRIIIPSLVEHCNAIVSKYRELAGENLKLAQIHRELAAQAKD